MLWLGILLFIETMNKDGQDIDICVTEGGVTAELQEVLHKYKIEIVEGVIQFPPRKDFKENDYRHKIEDLFDAIDVYILDIEDA